ncbi:MAG: aminotransferase class III-fold pyridoxal phosphate-dependent enzyme, partial [Actinobacteria bacterium]|nr:aminotransferase class III-fold pyridoxal phosphate-dependent enzyme [Actinomycetota bacterium]
MTDTQTGGLARPDVSERDAETIARECYGLDAAATELGSNQDRNFLLSHADGTKSVLRIDNPVFEDAAREGQHAALTAYRAAGVPVASVLPGLNGELTQRWNGFAVRRSEFAAGETLVDAGYLAPVVLSEFGRIAAASVNALADLRHDGLDRAHMWDMRVAYAETLKLAPAITDLALRERVLSVAEEAHAAISAVADALPVQAIHGDVTDDNVMGRRGDDTRLHPHTLIDLGDLSYGWRVAELAVTIPSMLHHDAGRPMRALDTIRAFHADAPLSAEEARALWPLVVLRSALLIGNGWRQLEIDGDNDYVRDRIAGEQEIFDTATRYPLVEMTEQVLAALHVGGAAPALGGSGEGRLKPVLPGLTGRVAVLDPGVESEALDAGKWLADEAEQRLIAAAFADGAHAAVMPYGVYRLTRTAVNRTGSAETWPADTEIHLPAGEACEATTPANARVVGIDGAVILEIPGGWRLSLRGVEPTVAVGTELHAGAGIGTVAASAEFRVLSVGLRRSDAPELPASVDGRSQMLAPERVAAWARFTHDPASILGLASLTQRDEAAEELHRRERIFASAQERYYERPMQIERGWRHHLVDTTGRSYVDMVNNVTGLGHGHPGVADAVNRQIRILNTNSRFLYRELAEYSERLLALLPAAARMPGQGRGALDTVLLVNSGSEA